ncbi:hypothetical protein [Gelidibacter pelagius]|uniref:Uncharacterized protein n=1 Tax=Gelidibacter pelagius TaxID=2819985 RepID=A0ABS3SVH7_9FLAO|nr:hypothetical protein [Gelidibacter pelagius]MBO3099451.1 hypothetical protein [Gelidibacter pelagius]
MELIKRKEINYVYSVVKLNKTLLVSNKNNYARCYEENNFEHQKTTVNNLNILKTFKNNDIIYLLDNWNKLFELKNDNIFPFIDEYSCTDSLEILNHIV